METQELILHDAIPADGNPAAVYLASLGKGSLSSQRSALRKIAQLVGQGLDTMNWGALRYQHVQLIRAKLQEKYSPATSNRLLTALRRVLREAWRLGYIPDSDYHAMAEIDPIRGAKDDTEEELTGRALSQDELTAILAACANDTTPAGARDAAIIALGYGLGLRRSEISKMQLSHYDRAKSIVTVKSGKGNKSRTLPIDDGAKAALNAWLKVRSDKPGQMFFGVDKGGTMHTETLSIRAVNELYEKRVKEAGIEDTNFHDLRRSFISDLLDKVDLVTVSRLAGHSDPRTTARYDRRKMETRRVAVRTLNVPFRKWAE